MENIKKVLPQDLSQLPSGVILDVRTKLEYAEKCLDWAHDHVPLHDLDPDLFMKTKGLEKDAPVYLLCRSGKRAAQAAQQFINQGYTSIHVIEGGMLSCEACGLKVKENPLKVSVISIERQGRIAAGTLVAIGSLLALFVDPLCVLLPLFVGCGLVFAGVTDFCGMGRLLLKAPWNKNVRFL